MVEVQVENIVVSFSVSISLDLPKLADALPDAQYNPTDVPALILQFSTPRSMAALSADGTVVMTGPKTMDEVDEVIKMIKDRLTAAGVELSESPEITVQNVSVSIDLHQELKLRSLTKSLGTAEYSPRVFPGIVYKEDDPNTVILLFDSGKIVCNARTLKDATVAVDKMVEKLLSFGIKMEEKECQK
jgi:transcription initiation factor TFIID TATA-box-binding protein